MRDIELDEIYDSMDTMCWRCEAKGDWQEMDDLLEELPIDNMETDGVIAYLTTSAWAKKKLNKREAFVDRARDLLTKRLPETAMKAIMQGLE